MKTTQQMLQYWQKKLRLMDWTIVVQDNVRPEDLLPNTAGECDYVESKKQAAIKIIDPKFYPPGFPVPFSKEQILVHELLHIKLCLLDESGNDIQNRIVHQLVDEFATILTEDSKHDFKEIRIKEDGNKT